MSGRPCELRKLPAALDPRTPIPQHADALPQVIAAPQPYADAAKAGDDAIDKAKQFGNLQARAAMLGIELCAAQDVAGRPAYAAIKWAEKATFTSLVEAAAWLDGLEGKRGGQA